MGIITAMGHTQNRLDSEILGTEIRNWGKELGFQQIGFSDLCLSTAEGRLRRWLRAGYHGTMDYMRRHRDKRSRPAELVPGTISVICARMDFLSAECVEPKTVLQNPQLGYISRYAVGRDYHKLLRHRLRRLAFRIATAIGPFNYRVFTDSAPVMEKPLAAKAALGWMGKHGNLLHRNHGSWFFLGEIYTDLPLPTTTPVPNHCGTCRACIEICPTTAIVEPYVVDARRCISYLTIEHRGAIPAELRPLLGNRIFGCDDCQLFCPWNRFAKPGHEPDFNPRHQLDAPSLSRLFSWSEDKFLRRTEGLAIRRIGHLAWLRNIAVALGNAPHDDALIATLRQRLNHPSALVREHVRWALERQYSLSAVHSTHRN